MTLVFQKAAGEPGWFGPTMGHAEDEDGLGQILSYNQDVERVLVAKTKDARPIYYYCFVTAYRDGVVPDRLPRRNDEGTGAGGVDHVITPQAMEEKP